MSIFDGIMGNLDGMAEKLGIAPDALQSLMGSAQEKLASGDFSGLMEAAQAHGLSLDKIQELMGNADMSGMMAKAQEMLGGGESGGGLGGLGDMAKGLFGKD